jgi:hypothetical protein
MVGGGEGTLGVGSANVTFPVNCKSIVAALAAETPIPKPIAAATTAHTRFNATPSV